MYIAEVDLARKLDSLQGSSMPGALYALYILVQERRRPRWFQ